MIQHLWEDFEECVKAISNGIDDDRNIRDNDVLLEEKGTSFTFEQTSLARKSRYILRIDRCSEASQHRICWSTRIFWIIASLKVDLNDNVGMQKNLKGVLIETMKTTQVLVKNHIYCQAYMSKWFIGPYDMKLTREAETVMNHIQVDLKENHHKDADQSETEEKCRSIK